jgi:hypothetical protein
MQSLIESFSEKNRPADAKFFRVKFKRSVMVPDEFGAMASSAIDEIRDVPESVASQVGDAAEILGEIVGGRLIERRRRIDPTTGIPPALPTPENYKALPAAFSELFAMEEKVRVLRERRDLWKSFFAALDSNNPDRRHYDRKVESAAADLAAVDLDKIAKLQLSVSSLTIQATTEANELRDEVERLAFEAFTLRAHGLGMESWQLERAFPGSALHRRFVREKLGLTSLRQAFIGTQMRNYLDLGLVQTVWYYERAAKAKAELEALRSEVKKEVATAKKTFGKELVAA